MNDKTGEVANVSFEQMFEEARQSPEFHAAQLKMHVAEQILLAMERAGIRKVELAERLGRSKGFITRILYGDHNLTLESMAQLAFCLGLTWDTCLRPLEAGKSERLDNGSKAPKRTSKRAAGTAGIRRGPASALKPVSRNSR